ncbi:MAG: YdcF family protein [Terracidiphilus sp.]
MRRRARRRSPLARLAIAVILLAIALLAWAALARHFAPVSNTSLTHFDAIVVLGSPADADGNPTPHELASVAEAVREYERGVAPRLIFTGAAVHNRFVEARTMAQAAEAQGIPPSAILLDTEARNTIQNACYSARILKAHGWQSAEVIASPIHLPRAAMIFSRLPLAWRMHAAPPSGPVSSMDVEIGTAWETLKTARYLVWARKMDRCEP